MSGYALLARAWGAEVCGWDRARTPYLERLEGIEVEISDDPPAPPAGWEAYVSSAFTGRIAGKTRAELLAELVSLRAAIVVAGAHGKTTTAGMIAFCLDRLGRDPAWLIGGDVPQLGGNAGTGAGWLVVEGDESDRTIASLRPQIGVMTNVDLDHHTTFGSRAEVEELFETWLHEVPEVVRGDELAPYDGPLAVPGDHNRRNAACAVAASRGEKPGSCLPGSPGRGGDWSAAARQVASWCWTTTRTIRPRSRRRSRRRAAVAGCSSFSSRTSTRARATSRVSWRMRSRGPTRSRSRRSTRRGNSPCRA